MKYWMPFLAGAVVGGALVNGMTERQRAKLAAGANRVMTTTTSRPAAVVGTVGAGVGDIADAATDRVNSVIENATTTVADRIADESTAS
jgi:hypothetical protein